MRSARCWRRASSSSALLEFSRLWPPRRPRCQGPFCHEHAAILKARISCSPLTRLAPMHGWSSTARLSRCPSRPGSTEVSRLTRRLAPTAGSRRYKADSRRGRPSNCPQVPPCALSRDTVRRTRVRAFVEHPGGNQCPAPGQGRSVQPALPPDLGECRTRPFQWYVTRG